MTAQPHSAPTDGAADAPDVLRAAYVDLIVSDLAKARHFYVDVLGLVITCDDDNMLCLRANEEFIHHNLVLREGPVPALAAIAYRVRTSADVDAAEQFYRARGCRTVRREGGFTHGVGDSVRVEDPLGFTVEFFHDVDHVDRNTRRFDLHNSAPMARMDHFNLVVNDVTAARSHLEDLGFRVTEDIRDDAGVEYAAWLRRKSTVHDTAYTGGDGPRLHHFAFATQESHNILALCDRFGALKMTESIERGPGRHGVSNAFYLYIRDPDGHRVEIYTHDYYTGDPDNPVLSWDVNDDQRRDWWGNPVVESWYTEASFVLDLDGHPRELVTRSEARETPLTIGADGFFVGTDARREAPSGSRSG